MTGNDTGFVPAILLAAGESRRMGDVNKLLLKVEGEAMVRRVARALIDSRADEVVVVLGHQAEAVGQALDGLEVRRVVNADYRDGQMNSMRAAQNKWRRVKKHAMTDVAGMVPNRAMASIRLCVLKIHWTVRSLSAITCGAGWSFKMRNSTT